MYKAAVLQNGAGFEIPVFRETSRYQYGQGLGDVLRGIVRFILSETQFFILVAMKDVQTHLKADSKAIKEGATVKDVIKFTLKPMVGEVLGATIEQVTSKRIEMRDNENDAPSPNTFIVVP